MMRNCAGGAVAAGQAEIADRADIGGAEFEPLTGVYFHGVQESAADKFGARDDWPRRDDIFLQKLQSIDRRFVLVAFDIGLQAVLRAEQAYPETLAAPIWFQDNRAPGEMVLCRLKQMVAAGNHHGSWRVDAGSGQRGILARLADFQVERGRSIDHAAVPPGQPGEHRGCQLRTERWPLVCEEALMRL